MTYGSGGAMESYPATTERRSTGWFARATIAGFVALAIATVALVAASGVAGALGEAYRDRSLIFDWMYQLAHNPVVELGRGSVFASLAVHMMFGMALAYLYALVFEPWLRRLPPWQAGALYSIVPFLLSVLVFLPITGGGLFGVALGAGPLPWLGNLVLHLLWGATLGIGYASGVERAEAAGDAASVVEGETPTMQRAELGAARGILIGAVVGGAIGAALGQVLPFASAEQLVGNWSVAMGVAGALSGAALGALIGSLSGLGDGEAVVVEDEPRMTGQPVAAALLPLGVIAVVLTLIVSIGSLLLTVAGDPHEKATYYHRPIIVGVTILFSVIIIAAIIDRTGRGSSHEHR